MKNIISHIKSKKITTQKTKNKGSWQRNKLFLGTFAPLIMVTIVACAVFASVSMRIINKVATSEALRVTTRIEADILEFLSPSLINVQDFANIAKRTQNRTVLNATIHSLGENILFSNGLYYGTRLSRFSGGSYYDSSDWVPPRDWEPANRDWFKNAAGLDGKLSFEKPYIDADSGELSVTIAQAVKDGNGAVRGVVAVDIVLNELTKRLADVAPPSVNGKLYLLSEDGSYLTNSDTEKIAKVSYFSESKIPRSLSDYLDGRQQVFTSGGQYYAVSKIGSTPFFVVTEGPLSDFTKNTTRGIFIFEVILVLFSIASSVLNLRTIQKMRKGERERGRQILLETQNLSVAAKENAATGQDQNAAVKEIVATMEDNSALAETAAQKITDVSSVAGRTNGNVHEGVELLARNVAQLNEIAQANQTTIEGIKALGDKIENIWDIVTLINSVADQAKIIAFNAELEASAAGEAGKNFHIVATEIRRLADGIIDGTKEIKEKITEIQERSDSLILASEDGTTRIRQGRESAKALEEKFSDIRTASEITAESAGDITGIIRQQAAAIEQVLATLRQIAVGVDNFTQATESISTASEKLRLIAGELN